MTAFIRQEALEKAREIQLKADEEFAIEKSKLVRQETASIDKLYEKKFKQAAMSQQITRSTLANRTRLRVLSGRQVLLDELFQQARERITEVSEKDAKKYAVVLKGLVLEALYILNEEKVTVQARKKDFDTVKTAIGEATAEYKEKVGRDTQADLDENEPLPEGSYVFVPPPTPYTSLIGWIEKYANGLVLVVWLLLVAKARSKSTRLSRSVCGCWRSILCLQSERLCLERTRTGDSLIS